WIAGTIALGTAWRQITVRLGKPFSLAMVTYSDSSTSTIDPRMIRLMYGVTASTSVAAGSTTTLGTFQACSPGGTIDTAGNKCDRLVANSSASPIPITNSGSAASASVLVESTWSVGLSRRTAMITPRKIDSGSATIAATKTRKAELANRPLSSVVTGCSVAAEVPRLPVSTSLS